jgi:SPP1 gp7 family putative phage head morphogenesis protein
MMTKSFKHILLSRRLATLADIRHEQAIDKMFRLEAEVDAMFGNSWGKILKTIDRGPSNDLALSSNLAGIKTLNILTDLSDSILNLLTKRFKGIVAWTFDRSFELFAHTLDDDYWTFLQRKFVERANFKVSVDPDTARAIYNPPTANTALDIIRADFPAESGINWEQRMQKLVSGVNPDKVAQIVARGIQNGENPIKVARVLRRELQIYKSGAERLARTEMLRISNKVAKDSWDDTFGDVIAGYQLRETLDSRTRASHAARHGDMYIKPKFQASFPGAKDIALMPILPDAPNCRGTNSPVLVPEFDLFGDFRKQSKIASVDGPIDDPGTYSVWFNQQDETRQARIVGRRRLNLVKKKLNGQPVEFSNFIDPDTQKMISVKALGNEDFGELLARTARNESDFERILKAIDSLFKPIASLTLPPGVGLLRKDTNEPSLQDPKLDTDADRGITPLEV